MRPPDRLRRAARLLGAVALVGLVYWVNAQSSPDVRLGIGLRVVMIEGN